MSAQPAAKIKRKSLRRRVCSFAAFFGTGLLCLLAILYSSPWGTQASIALINKFTPLSLHYKSGMFSEGVEFSKFTYQNKYVDINASDLTVNLHLRCLWQKKLCVENLNADSLSIKISPSKNKEQKHSEFSMPIAISANTLTVSNVTIKLLDHTVKLSNLSTAIDIKDKDFIFNNTSIESALTTSESLNINSNTKVKSATDITLSDINLPITLSINQLLVNSLKNDSAFFSFLPPEFTQVDLSLNWLEHDLFITSLSSHYPNGEFSSNGKVSFLDNYPIDFQITHKLIHSPYWPEINQSNQVINIDGDLSALKTKFKSEGSIALMGTGSINSLKTNMPYNLKIDATKIPFYNQVSQHIHPSRLSLISTGNKNAQTVSIKSTITGLGYSNADLSLIFDHKRTSSNVLNDIFTFKELNLNDANNNINLIGSIALGDTPTWDINLSSTGFTFPLFQNTDKSKAEDELSVPLASLLNGEVTGRINGKLTSSGTFNKENTTLNLTNTNLSGVINKVPFSIEGKVELNKGLQLKPSHLQVSVYNSKVSLSGYSDKEWFLKGTITAPKMKQFVPDIKGEFTSNFTVNGSIKNPTIQFNNDFKNFTFQRLLVPSMTIKGDYLPFEHHQINAHIHSQQLDWFDTSFLNFIGNINTNINQQSIDFSWGGDFKGQFLLNGHLNDTTKNWVGIIAGAEVNYLTNNWQPNTDILINYNHTSKQISLNEHCWKNPGLSVCLTKDTSFFEQGNIPLFLKFNSYYFNETFAPKDISLNAIINGDANISWGSNKPISFRGGLSVLAGNVLLTPEENYLPVKVLSAWDTGHFDFEISKSSLTTKLTLGPDAINRANINYDFYSDINIKSVLTFSDHIPLSTQLIIDNFNLRPFQPMNHDLALLEGTLSGKLNITGNLTKPIVKGDVKLSQGQLKLIKSPNILDELELALVFSGTDASINGAFKIDENAGSITGDASWLNEKMVNLTFDADRLNILVPPQIEATIAPTITAKLTENNLDITGSVNVLDGIIQVTKLPEGSVKLSNDVIFVDYQGEEILNKKPFNINSDINLIINESFELTGQGFDGNLEGNLKVQHNNYQPLQLFGNLNIPNGRYQAYGQRLYIDRGKIAFNGPVDNPNIDLRATRTIPQENIKVGVELTGLVDALSLNLFSTPSLTRAQTLSYLLRGQGLDNDNDDSSGLGVALGAALANYSGIFKQIDKLPLINNVEIDGDNTQVSIAGYLGKRIYLKYGIGVDEPVNELTVRLFLMSRLWVETISGLESSADIYYSFDSNL